MRSTPTSASWLNLVERFFRDLTERSPDSTQRIQKRQGTGGLDQFVPRASQHRNANPKPYSWTAHPNAILDKVKRANYVARGITAERQLFGIESAIDPDCLRSED